MSSGGEHGVELGEPIGNLKMGLAMGCVNLSFLIRVVREREER